MNVDPPDSPRSTVIVLAAIILGLQAVLAIHSPLHASAYFPLLFTWIGFMAMVTSPAYGIWIILGAVFGEAVAALWVVPWRLTIILIETQREATPVLYLVRLFCILMSVQAYLFSREWIDDPGVWSEMPSGGLPLRRTPGAGKLLGMVGCSTILLAAAIQRETLTAEKSHFAQLAIGRAKVQLGKDYSDYDYFLKNIDLKYRVGQSILIKAALVAYNNALEDAQDVAVSWVEPTKGVQHGDH